MRITPEYIAEMSRQTGFDPVNLEKVLRLKNLLNEFDIHPLLRDTLVLKGGTAINVFESNLPRLSVDIDLNYVGQLEKEAMTAERPRLEQAVLQVCRGLGYRIQPGTNEHAMFQLYLAFTNHARRQDTIEVEINFLMRVCALARKRTKAIRRLADEPPCEFPVLAIEELMAGKLKAMIERRHPRDLYDIYRFVLAAPAHDPELLRKLTVLFASTLNPDLRAYKVERFDAISQQEVERLLYPLLRAEDRPTVKGMLPTVRPLLASVLEHQRERAFLEALAAGKYEPTLLFPNRLDIATGISRHPALLWKAQNVADYLVRKKGSVR